jgi:hypothetical protein
MPIGPGGLDSNGIWQFGEDDSEALASDLLNLGMSSVSTAIGSLPAPADPAILQVVSTTKTDVFSASLSTGWVGVTGLTASLTPSSTSSKILVSGYCSVATSLTENSKDIAIYRDGVALTGASGDANGSAKRATSGGVAYTTSQRGIASVPFSFLDSPNTTSTVSYEIYIGYTNNSATTMYVNRAASDGTSDYNSRWASSITLMEVAG